MDLATTAVFTGNAHPQLAQDIARCLRLPLARAQVGRFSDGEINVEILENIRGRETFIIQPTCPPSSENLMELLVMVDAARRASAARITAVVPYFGFARQDRRPRSSRVPITAKLVAKMFGTAGVDRVLTVDLHADQIQGFFDIPVDHLYSAPVLLSYLTDLNLGEVVVVSPDAGGVERARAFAKRLGAGLAIIDKRRTNPNVSEVMNIIGDVEGKAAIVVDDMIDTGGTLTQGLESLKAAGAGPILACAAHPVFSGPAIQRLTDSPAEKIIVTDTIPLSEEASKCDKIVQLSVGELLAEAIRRIHNNESVSSLFV